MTLLLILMLVVVAHHVLVRGGRAVALAAQPLSEPDTDAAVYHRSIFTWGDRDLAILWALLLADAGLWWGLLVQDTPALGWPAIGLLLASVAWELWTWDRVAASVKFVTWRRGWRQSARRVPTAQIAEVAVAESSRRLRLGRVALSPPACRMALSLTDGTTVKLPLTCVWTSLDAVESVANFVRMQADVAADAKRRVEQEKRHEARQQGKRILTPEERALRKDLMALRKGVAGSSPPKAPPEDPPKGA